MIHFITGERKKRLGAEPGVRMIMPDRWLLAKNVHWGASLDPDFLLVCLGRHHLRALKKDFFKVLTDGGKVHTVFCNCDPSEPERLGFERESRSLLLTLMEAVKQQDHEVELVSEKPVFLIEKASPAWVLWKDLESFGITVHQVDDLVPCLNSFFVYQLLFLPEALCNTTLPHFLSFREGRELARGILEEGLAAMEKTGRKTARLPLMDPRELLHRIKRNPSSFDEARFSPGRAFPSMLQALLKGKPIEARELNKRAVELASSAGIESPWNWKVFQKAGRASNVGFYPSPAALLRSLG
jgi:hypothetical protein